MSDQASTSSDSPAATIDINTQKLLDKERSRVAAKAKREEKEKEKEADAKDLAASLKAFDDAQKKRFPIDFIYIQRRHLKHNYLNRMLNPHHSAVLEKELKVTPVKDRDAEFYYAVFIDEVFDGNINTDNE
ncbi:hypothetical protein BV898_01731 [Hypsibius exemplaris]|uniref:Uncharacterized protein n=1 Tax=Hypsibius exemplaris TaxID=2072580 RepID=A0A1W0XBH8_HYPEX|nr:hypothetical protein BV898_01731 [Hypsibius exemplaris]